MDIPDWFIWIAFGLFVLQVLALVPVIRRMRGADPAVRSEARLDLLETAGTLLFSVGLAGSLLVAELWSLLALVGLVLIAVVYVLKGIRLLRARRRPMA
ncbi:hypothetical protein [Streptomyces sp. NPDC046385]|uniref:hypothetical protein n=1 Tax=Streptomyces sp. NPDC046385 TaxID=3154918 RepID=UPI003400F3FD